MDKRLKKRIKPKKLIQKATRNIGSKKLKEEYNFLRLKKVKQDWDLTLKKRIARY